MSATGSAKLTAVFVGLIVLTATVEAGDGNKTPAESPLTVLKANPRYFTDGSGRAVYLTGSHTWDTFQVWFEGSGAGGTLKAGRPGTFDDYLDELQKHRHNFIRLWVADTAWSPVTKAPIEPQPYVRTGPGKAADGGLKFDLNKLNQAYFDKLRNRVVAARDRGIYVAVMLFNVWGTSNYGAPNNVTWNYHPFHKANNINGIDGDPNGDGRGREYHTLRIPAITRLQEAYVRKVIDTVGDLGNVLYEISNESRAESKDWQYHLITFVQDEEADRPQQHPVLMSGYSGGVLIDGLLASPAEAIAPNGLAKGGFPAATGAKVVILDSDHNGSTRSDPEFVWKAFLRGYHPIVMDWWSGPAWEPIRRAMGHTRTYAEKMNLAAMTPQDDLSSTKFCLANPGTEYLVYLPSGGAVTLDLTAASGTLRSEWMHPVEGTITPGETISGGAKRTLKAPFRGHAVLYLWKAK
jgi:hypothetical protein